MTERNNHTSETIARFAARLFSSEEGECLLDYLEARTRQRVLAADCSCRVLRHLEGQRFLVAHLRALIARGHKP